MKNKKNKIEIGPITSSKLNSKIIIRLRFEVLAGLNDTKYKLKMSNSSLYLQCNILDEIQHFFFFVCPKYTCNTEIIFFFKLLF